MSIKEITPFAFTNFRNEKKRFGIKRDDRRRHMYVIGKTGMGKSVLIENMAYSDIMAGKGVCVVDPHGDLVEKLIKCIPSNRINDVVYFNPADLDNPLAFNVLEQVEPRYRHIIASGLVGVFKKIWADSWGPRLEYLLRNTILALLDFKGSTLLGINRMFVDKEYRKKIISKIQDPVVKAFWVDEFSKYSQQFLVEAVSPIQNKVGQFLSTRLIRNIVGQVGSTVDLRKIMDDEKILLLNLSKGRIGEDSSQLLGAMMITKIQLAAMSRVNIPEEERRDFYLYVDEFQNFATESFANILSEARKYRLNLIVAHQYIEQLNEKVRSAVFGNVGTIICFRVGAGDANFLVQEFTPQFVEEDLVNIPKYNVYLKLMIDGVASNPFSAGTLPPITKETDTYEKVLRSSRERYSSPAEEVEEKIARWSGMETEAMLEKLEKKQQAAKIGKVFNRKIDLLSKFKGEDLEAVEEVEVKPTKVEEKDSDVNKDFDSDDFNIVKCNSCGTKTKVGFKPDGVRPVFCKECLKDYRRQQSKIEEAKKLLADVGGRDEQKPRIQEVKKSSHQETYKSREPVVKEIKKEKEPEKLVKEAPKERLSLNDLKNKKVTSFHQKRNNKKDFQKNDNPKYFPKEEKVDALSDEISQQFQDLTSGADLSPDQEVEF